MQRSSFHPELADVCVATAIGGQLLEIMSEGEDEKTMDSNNNGYEEGGGGERTSLMLDKEVRPE